MGDCEKGELQIKGEKRGGRGLTRKTISAVAISKKETKELKPLEEAWEGEKGRGN